MQCQRHNSEAVIKGLNDKLKEKDKDHRFGPNFNHIVSLPRPSKYTV